MKYIILICSLFSVLAYGEQKMLDVDNIDKFTEKFMSHVEKNDFKKAYTILKPYWPLPSHEIEALIYQTESQWTQLSNRIGKSIGYELVRDDYLGYSVFRRIYVQKFEHHAIAWLITFYKPKDKWLVNQVMFSDQLNLLF